ncbi:MAG TPA: hypothetical protein VMV92_45495 [Streptosporangiaceae bacterium]|nr:hypothetical protein [Streptosporangiaceae bacterium]
MSLLSGTTDLTALNFWWGMAYDIHLPGEDHAWTAKYKRDSNATLLEEDSAEMLLYAVRQDYRTRKARR